MFKSLLALLILSGASMQIGYAADHPEQIHYEGKKPLATLIEEQDALVSILKVDQEQPKIDNATPTEDSQSMTQILTKKVQWVMQYLWEFWDDPFGFNDMFKDISLI